MTKSGAIVVSKREFLNKRRRALAAGAVHAPDDALGRVLRWDLTVKSKHPCLSPPLVSTIQGAERRSLDTGGQNVGSIPQMDAHRIIGSIEMYGRCRRCAPCLLFRKKQWIARMRAEFIHPDTCRCWFVTLTMAPAFAGYIRQMAEARANLSGQFLASLPEAAQFEYLAGALKPEMQRYIKRVRKGVGKHHNPRFKYLCVFEPHKSGLPHAHLLVYEKYTPDLTQRLLRGRWNTKETFRGSITQAKLVNHAEGVAYTAKYLAKEFSVRPLVSSGFGK